MDASHSRQSLNHRASEQTLISLLELDPSPIDSPTPSDEKQLEDVVVDSDGSDTIMAASSDSTALKSGSTAAAPGLGSSHHGHGSIFYLSRIQRYSSYAMSIFTSLHLANVSLIPAIQRSVPSSETHPLMARAAYLGLITLGMGHMVWGMAKWWGYAPSTQGWQSSVVVVDKKTKRARRNRWLSVHGAAALAALAWAVGGLAVVARGGLQVGWGGKVYDDMFATVGL
ncbi:hypothetical protein PWT90_04588 [Aphanocladium album]|nr:hypothetical protein PWT90_04588 [Aphanocladium album]